MEIRGQKREGEGRRQNKGGGAEETETKDSKQFKFLRGGREENGRATTRGGGT